MKRKVQISKTTVLIIALLLISGISSAGIAEDISDWGINYQKEFSEFEFDNYQSWETDNSSEAYIMQKGDDNYSSIKQNGRENYALTIQVGNQNSARIEQTGNSNSAVIKQLSDNNTARISQAGSNNKAFILQN